MNVSELGFTAKQIRTIASIVQVGEAVYNELTEKDKSILGHPYLSETRARMRTKLVQIQCQIESQDPTFPFQFSERVFAYDAVIPELRTENCILHFGRSKAPDVLPYVSGYKKELSQNNDNIRSQLMIDFEQCQKTTQEPFYGMVVFGGTKEKPFIVIQFPEPGFTRIAKTITIPRVITFEGEQSDSFERKKAVLKKEYLEHRAKEDLLK